MRRIEMNTIGDYVCRPYIEINIADNPDFTNKIEIIAIIDTGADISFIENDLVSKFNFFKKTDEYKGLTQTMYKIYYQIPDLKESGCILSGARPLPNNNPKEKKFDMLLGRDFLKNCEMQYSGIGNTIILKWIK